MAGMINSPSSNSEIAFIHLDLLSLTVDYLTFLKHIVDAWD